MNKVFIMVPKDKEQREELLLSHGLRLRKGINHHNGMRNTEQHPQISDALETLERDYNGKSIMARIANIYPMQDARFVELEVTNASLEPEVFQSKFWDFMNEPQPEPAPKRGRKKTVVIIHEKVTRIIFYNPEN